MRYFRFTIFWTIALCLLSNLAIAEVNGSPGIACLEPIIDNKGKLIGCIQLVRYDWSFFGLIKTPITKITYFRDLK